jgi:hypothetical protein
VSAARWTAGFIQLHFYWEILTVRRLFFAALLFLTGCWNTDPAELPVDQIDFQPEFGTDIDWTVRSYELGLYCPDGERARFYFVHPKDIPDEPMPGAVLYHSGAFDYVYSPQIDEPLAGTHYQVVESRLQLAWAIRRIFVMLGMFPEDDPYEYHLGSLPLALAEQGVATIIPLNCWGDLWHNRAALAENSFIDDRFFRNGRVSAEWGWRFLIDAEFAAEQGVVLPVTIDPEQTYAFGLGEGSRAVNEILVADTDQDGAPDFSPVGILLDSSPDDLRSYYADPVLYAELIAGFNRIYGDSEGTKATSLAFVPSLPERVAYIYSTADTRMPAGIHDEAVSRLTTAGKWVKDIQVAKHILTNADDMSLTREAVAYVIGAEAIGADTGAPSP